MSRRPPPLSPRRYAAELAHQRAEPSRRRLFLLARDAAALLDAHTSGRGADYIHRLPADERDACAWFEQQQHRVTLLATIGEP